MFEVLMLERLSSWLGSCLLEELAYISNRSGGLKVNLVIYSDLLSLENRTRSISSVLGWKKRLLLNSLLLKTHSNQLN